VSISYLCSSLGGSLANGLHPWWHSPTRHSPTSLFTPHHDEVHNGFGVVKRPLSPEGVLPTPTHLQQIDLLLAFKQ